MTTESMRPPPPAAKPGRRAAMILAVIVHLALAVFLIYGVNWQTKAPEAVSVELVAAPAAVPPAPTPAPEPKPEPQPEPPPPPKAAPKTEPKPEPKPAPPRPDIAVKEKEKPKPKEAPPPPPPPPKVDPFQEQLKRESQAIEQQKKIAEADAYLEKVKVTQAAAARKRDIDIYLTRIRGKIRGNIVLPPEVKGNPEANFEITQLPSGEVISVKLKKSSGVVALDNAIERAILKSSPLPKPDKPELFDRLLDLKYRPFES